MEPCIIIHGGSRTIPEDRKESYRQDVQLAARKGYEVLLEVQCSGSVSHFKLFSLHARPRMHVKTNLFHEL